MPTPGGIPKRGDTILNTTIAGTRFTVIDRTSSTYPMTISIVREDGREFPPQFDRSKFHEDGSYPLQLETKYTFSTAGWRYANSEQPSAGTAIGRPKYTLELDRESETYEFQPQRRIPTIPSRSNWEDYMESHNTPDRAFEATMSHSIAFGEKVEWRVVLKRTTVEIVHQIK